MLAIDECPIILAMLSIGTPASSVSVPNVCLNYGQRVQNSVFECLVEPASYVELKEKLLSIINMEQDSIRFYHIGNSYESKIEIFGRTTSFDFQGELVF